MTVSSPGRPCGAHLFELHSEQVEDLALVRNFPPQVGSSRSTCMVFLLRQDPCRPDGYFSRSIRDSSIYTHTHNLLKMWRMAPVIG
jgi:hypothetical protein